MGEHFKQETASGKDDCVILLHGLARTSRSMARMAKRLSQHGYQVINLDYPSTEHPIEFLAEEYLGRSIERCKAESHRKIHFVTHSLGGIIVRYYLKHHELSNLGRVVMMSPPNQGSEVVDYMKDTLVFKRINGPAGQQLGTDVDSVPLKLGPVDFELGIITGNRTLDPLFSMLIPGPDDGKVSVKRAKVAGMADFLVLPRSHMFIMQKEDVIEQVIHFLEHGSFGLAGHDTPGENLK
ncbi:MAG: alpha/beta fold hydrolase [Candidatus Aminicenantes bacterium]|nr:alpha/beta fold hydrolase [Candidatus Aminicenantes bacterium]